ncbi:MAG TPA: hypothetical protein VJY39_06525 [Acidisphaera sp.]|nr:hypothetical protein [Acidisphaera sp.]
MDDLVDVTIPVEQRAAAVLADERNRAVAGRLLSEILVPRPGPNPLVQALAEAIAELKAEARAAGLTDPDIDAELEAYNAERRERTPKA